MEEEKDVLKQFEKTDKELIHDVIDMKLLDINTPLDILKREWKESKDDRKH